MKPTDIIKELSFLSRRMKQTHWDEDSDLIREAIILIDELREKVRDYKEWEKASKKEERSVDLSLEIKDSLQSSKALNKKVIQLERTIEELKAYKRSATATIGALKRKLEGKPQPKSAANKFMKLRNINARQDIEILRRQLYREKDKVKNLEAMLLDKGKILPQGHINVTKIRGIK